MSSLLFYQRIVTLDRERHVRLKLRPSDSLGFAAGSSAVPLLCTEFAATAREYPIAFLRGADQQLLPVALTGAPSGRNVYMDDAGRWNARYVPAYVRRYPFVFAELAPDQLTVCIDEACPALNEDEGEALFDAGGEPSATLNQVISLLSEYQRQARATQAFMQRLEASGLLMEASARADAGDGRSLALQGFWIVDEARFAALPEATLKAWFASGELGLVYAHLLSLANLMELARRQPEPVVSSAAVPADPPTPPSPTLHDTVRTTESIQ